MTFDLHLTNAQVVTGDRVVTGGVAVTDGTISLVHDGQANLPARRTVDLDGRVLFPGVIDAHVHFSEVGRAYEGYETGSRAAAAGGVTTVLEMPLNDLPATTDRKTLHAKREIAENLSIVDYAHWGGFVNDNLADLRDLHEDGVIGYKAFMKCCTDFPHIDDGLLRAGLAEVAQTGNVIGVHAENDAVVTREKNRLIAQGRLDRAALAEAHTKEQELEAIHRALYWAKVTGGAVHIVHVSIAEGVRAVARARLEGVRATAETCAHYLFFDESDHLRRGPDVRCFPPIRDRAEVEALWQCVADGTLDMVTSDHSPFLPADRDAGDDNVWLGAGIRGVQSTLPAMITAGVHERGVPWSRLAELLATAPARTFGLDHCKGAIAPGLDADFVVIDPDVQWVLRSEDLHYRHPYSAYVDAHFTGVVTSTWVRGQVVFDRGSFTASPGYGQLLRRG